MSDVEHDIRQMLLERAGDVTAPPTLPRATLGRARVRRVTTASTMLLSLLLIAVGSIWVADRLNRSTTIQPAAPRVRPRLQIALPSLPRDVALGLSSVWTATDDSLVRVDPRSGRILGRWIYPGAGYPSPANEEGNLAVESHAAWVLLDVDGSRTTFSSGPTVEATEPGGGRRLGVGGTIGISPAPPGFKRFWTLYRVDGETARGALGTKRYDGHAWTLSAGPTGVWVGTSSYVEEFSGSLERYDPVTGSRTGSIRVPGKPIAIDARTDDVVAIVQTPGERPNQIVRIDVARGTVAAALPIGGGYDVSVGAGNAWVSERTTNATMVHRVQLPGLIRTGSVRIRAPEVSNYIEDLVVTDATVWVMGGFPQRLLWIGPDTARIVGSVDPHNVAQNIAADLRNVWLAENVNNTGTLYGFDVGEVFLRGIGARSGGSPLPAR